MSSKPIYPHVPYFYIIEHVASGKKYAGCRYAKGCNPVEFMTEDGYCTSSSTVKQIIEDDGIDAFVVVEIKTIDEVGDVYDYETNFLVENNCAASDQWFNMHNNAVIAFGSKEFKAAMLAKRGVESAMRSEVCKEKSKRTCLDRYGTEHAIQSEVVKSKSRKTCLDTYGVEYSLQSEEVRNKSRASLLDRYGVDHPMYADEIKEIQRQTCLKNHGVENPSQSEAIKEQKRQTTLKNHGVENPGQSDVVKEKIKQTNLKNHGVDNYSKTDEFKENYKQWSLQTYGVENPSQSEEVKEQKRLTLYKNIDMKISDKIINGNFSQFIYLYDMICNVFLMGVEVCLNRGLEQKRYIKITSNKGSKKYIDVLTGKSYRINPSKFSVPLPSNFILC